MIGAAVAASAAVAWPAPAQADDHSFLADVGKHIVIHDADKTLRDGHMACDLRQDHKQTDVVEQVRRSDGALSKLDAALLVGSAYNNLC